MFRLGSFANMLRWRTAYSTAENLSHGRVRPFKSYCGQIINLSWQFIFEEKMGICELLKLPKGVGSIMKENKVCFKCLILELGALLP